MKLLRGHLLGGLVAVLLGGLSISAARADQILFVTQSIGSISEYDLTTGAMLNAALASALLAPAGIAVSGRICLS